MSIHRNLMTVCFAAVFALGLGACSSSSDDDPPEVAVTEPEPMPEPEPEPAGPTDLEETQMAAKAAADAAMASSTAADTAAMGAEEATANIATLQTGGTAMMAAMDARKYAKMAMAEYDKAKMASDAAAAATTSADAEAAWRNAENAKDAAAAAQAMASEHAMAAEKAAKMELHIDGTMKSVGDGEDKSSVDASMGMLTTTNDDGSKTITGMVGGTVRDVAAIPGRMFTDKGTATVAPDDAYRQAVEARKLTIGKMVDTSDDKARVSLVDSYAGSKKVRVYVEASTDIGTGTDPDSDATPANFHIRTDSKGMSGQSITDLASIPATLNEATTKDIHKLRSVGEYYKADDKTPPVDANSDATDTDDFILSYSDEVEAATTKGTEVLSYVVPGAGTDPDKTWYVVEVSRTVDTANKHTTVTYRHVDVTAAAAPDDRDTNPAPQQVGVTASIPMAVKYSHIHFGVWAGLGKAEKDGTQKLAGLGIGFVQNIGEGMPTGQGIGMATFKGDWVAAVQPMHSDSVNLEDGAATLTANFAKGTVKGVLDKLATLEGDLSGYGFSGTKATAISHPDLDADGTFEGEFSGGIYGPAGDEAAGVFDFAGGEAGSFRGAFGGTSKP